MVHDADPADIDLGEPGSSARAEYERRLRSDAERRRRRFGRLFALVVSALAGVRPSTARWRTGGLAEERVGRLLSEAVGDRGFVLHDRAVPRSRANLDHIAIVPSGVWVVDTKRYRGRVRRGLPEGRLVGRRTLVVNGRDRGELVTAARRQRSLVESAVGRGVEVRAVLCFAGAEWGLAPRPFSVGGVAVTWPKALVRRLAGPGPVGPDRRHALATSIARAFPPRADRPSGEPRSGAGARGSHRRA